MHQSADPLTEVVGYLSTWSASPGDQVSLHASGAGSYTAEVVRLLGATPEGAVRWSAAPGARAGRLVLTPQPIRSGSGIHVEWEYHEGEPWSLGLSFRPTRTTPECQLLVTSPAAGWAVVIVGDRLEWLAGDGTGGRREIGPVVQGSWHTVVIGDAASHRPGATLVHEGARSTTRAEFELDPRDSVATAGKRDVFVGSISVTHASSVGSADRLAAFDGVVAGLWAAAGERPASRDRLSQGEYPGTVALDDPKVVHWMLSREPSSDQIPVTRAGRVSPGRAFNGPTRAVLSPWQGLGESARYDAAHLHSDDIEDAAWPAAASFEVHGDWPSGLYAVRVSKQGRDEFFPFVVRSVTPQARILLVLPTFTYLAYANEAMPGEDSYLADRYDEPIRPGPHDAWIEANPEAGISLYDRHRDGSGACLSSRLRPVPSLSPHYVSSLLGFLRHLAADLWIIDWFRRNHLLVDVCTDEDLNRDGAGVLSPYQLVVTGSHPEYVTPAVFDAVEDFVSTGGNLIYCGGNGFYWVTGTTPGKPHVIEVRRGPNAGIPWESVPGEERLQTNGWVGGRWLEHGPRTAKLLGVHFSWMGVGAAPFRRSDASFTARFAALFENVDDTFGATGSALGAAAGHEVDRADPLFGTTADTVVVATAGLDETSLEDARADLTWTEHVGGGVVVSVSSMCAAGALAIPAEDDKGFGRLLLNCVNLLTTEPE